MAAPTFRPGFRCSVVDGVVLTAGAIGAVAVWPHSAQLAILGLVVVLHFFLFCNVFRVARKPELCWSLVFVACVCLRVGLGLPWWGLASVVAVTTLGVLWRETRKNSYPRPVLAPLQSWLAGVVVAAVRVTCMSLARHGSRTLTVDGVVYRWVVSPDSGFMVLVVELDGDSGQRLEATLCYRDDGPGAASGAVTPAVVRRAIERALADGWVPSARGRKPHQLSNADSRVW